ncbi:hypothetical protein D3C86_1177470 [compost metagenome]
MLEAGDVRGLRRAGLDAGRAGEHQMRLGQLREAARRSIARSALDGVVLRLEGLGHLILIALDVRLGLLRRFGQALVLIAPGGESGQGLPKILGVFGGVAARLGGDEQAILCPQNTVAVGTQFKPLSPRVLASGVVFDAGDVPKAQLAMLMIALELRLDLPSRVVQGQVVAAPGCAVAAFLGQLPAPES